MQESIMRNEVAKTKKSRRGFSVLCNEENQKPKRLLCTALTKKRKGEKPFSEYVGEEGDAKASPVY